MATVGVGPTYVWHVKCWSTQVWLPSKARRHATSFYFAYFNCKVVRQLGHKAIYSLIAFHSAKPLPGIHRWRPLRLTVLCTCWLHYRVVNELSRVWSRDVTACPRRPTGYSRVPRRTNHRSPNADSKPNVRATSCCCETALRDCARRRACSPIDADFERAENVLYELTLSVKSTCVDVARF